MFCDLSAICTCISMFFKVDIDKTLFCKNLTESDFKPRHICTVAIIMLKALTDHLGGGLGVGSFDPY